MYAIIKTGGKQYKVAPGDEIQVEKLEGSAGDKVTLDEVLALGGDKPSVGAPLVDGASVSAEIVDQGRRDKVIVFKKKRRHNYRRKMGHRQTFTTLKILDVAGSGAKKATPAKKPEAKKADEKPATKAAAKPAAKKETKATTGEKKAPAKKAAPKKAAAKKPAAKKPAAKKEEK
tara:strand:- start:378 stop:899 length:522 start_codon:yes stop_codon:yes gene_type:complete